MLINYVIRSTAAFGGAPFRFNKCTALSSTAGGAAGGAAVGGVPGALVGGALGMASALLGGLFGKSNTNKKTATPAPQTQEKCIYLNEKEYRQGRQYS